MMTVTLNGSASETSTIRMVSAIQYCLLDYRHSSSFRVTKNPGSNKAVGARYAANQSVPVTPPTHGR